MTETYGKRPLWQWVLIYLVVGGFIYWLVWYFVLAKNGGYNSMYSAPTSDAMKKEVTVDLGEENDSGESGTAILEEKEGKATVTNNLPGYPTDGTAQPAHLHVGACPGVGAVKFALTSIVNGTSVTTLDVTLAQLTSELPLALNVHKSAAEAKVYTACGGLSL